MSTRNYNIEIISQLCQIILVVVYVTLQRGSLAERQGNITAPKTHFNIGLLLCVDSLVSVIDLLTFIGGWILGFRPILVILNFSVNVLISF